MNDATTTVAELRDLVRRFVDERDWRQFHTPKNLAMSISIEAAELMEHFQWLTAEQSAAMANTVASTEATDAEKRYAVGEELADVVCYALALANAMELDLADCVAKKMIRNAAKYPAGEFQGRYGHDDPGPSQPSDAGT